MCHGFLAGKDSGERLSHAVGCAFAVCLERKQRRDKECGVTMAFDMKTSTFTRSGSFRAQTFTERLDNNNANTAIVAPQPKPVNPFAIERPHAAPHLLERQGSFRGFEQIGTQSPFKRQMSLRITDLPSNAERQKKFLDITSPTKRTAVSPIPEVSPQPPLDTVSALCQELSQGLSLLTRSDTDDLIFNTNHVTETLKQVSAASAANALAQPIITSPLSPFDCPSTPLSVFTSDTITNVQKVAPLSPISPVRSPLLSPRSNALTTTTSITSSVTTTETKVVPIEAVAPLPKPDQWLEQMARTTVLPSASPPRRPPSIGMAGRARSMSVASDPFDSEWVSPVQRTEVRSTNPFISPPKAPVQTFQLQL